MNIVRRKFNSHWIQNSFVLSQYWSMQRESNELGGNTVNKGIEDKREQFENVHVITGFEDWSNIAAFWSWLVDIVLELNNNKAHIPIHRKGTEYIEMEDLLW